MRVHLRAEFNGPGITGNQFDPAVAGQGTWDIYYIYNDANGCSDSALQQITVDLCTGISDLASPSVLEVYPNPFNEMITVVYGTVSVNGTLGIFDVLGQEVFVTAVTSQKTEINLSQFPAGIYYVKIQSNEGIVTKQILKQ